MPPIYPGATGSGDAGVIVGGNVGKAAIGAGLIQAPIPSMPALNMLGGWSARSTGTAGVSGTLSLNDLSGNGAPITSTSATNPLVLLANDPVCGGAPSVSSTQASNAGVATIASYSTPITVYLVGYATVASADMITLGGTILRLFVGLSGSAETWTYRLPTSGNQVTDANGVNTTASIVCFTVPVTAGTFNSYVGQSTPATGTGTAGVIPTGQTAVKILSAGGNVGGTLAEFYLYSGADAQPARLAKMNTLAQRCGLGGVS